MLNVRHYDSYPTAQFFGCFIRSYFPLDLSIVVTIDSGNALALSVSEALK